MDARRQLAQRPGLLEAYDALFADAQLGLRRHRLPDDPGGRRQPATAAGRRPRCDAPLRVRMRARRRRPRPADGASGSSPRPPTPGASLRATWPPRSSQLLTDGARAHRPASRDGVEIGRTTAAPGPHRRAGAHEQPGRDRARRAARRRRPGGDRRRRLASSPPSRRCEWLRLLEALERPTARDRASLAALTCFVGWTPEEVATAGRRRVGGRCTGRCTGGRRCCASRAWPRSTRRSAASARGAGAGAGAPVGRALHDRPAPRRASCCTRPASTEGLGPTALATWLGRRIDEADRDGENEERARRLESDAEAVQVHHDPPQQGPRVPGRLLPLHVGRPPGQQGRARAGVPRSRQRRRAHHRRRPRGHRASPRHQQLELDEDRGEDLRLAVRGADPGPAPGGPVVGRGQGQPALAAGPAALRS